MKARAMGGWYCFVALFYLVSYACVGADVSYRFERLWPTLAQPWYFNSPAGLACDASGNVYIADSFNGRIQKFTAQGNFISMWNGLTSGGAAFSMPQDVAVDLDDNVYVVDSQANRVRVFTASGAELAAWGAAGSGLDQFSAPQGIALSPSGLVYVADTQNHRITCFDAAGTPLGLFGESIVFQEPHDLAFDDQGNAYVADTGNHRIVVLDSDGAFVREIGGSGSDSGLFNRPGRVLLDAENNLYVSDQLNYRIQKFDPAGAYIAHWGSEGHGNGEFAVPDGLALGAFGQILVSDRGWHDRIQVFTNEGVFMSAWGSQRGGRNEFDGPTDLVVDDALHVYVADFGNGRIQHLNASGRPLGNWGPGPSDPGYCRQPYSLALDTLQNLAYAYDLYDGNIRQYEQNGTFLREWSGQQGDPEGFVGFVGLAAVGDSLYMADAANHRIRQFDATGAFIREWGERGSDIGQFISPYDIVADNSGVLHVTDTYNNRIQTFDTSGNYLNSWGEAGSGPGAFNHPLSIALAPDGTLLITDSDNHRVQQFTTTGAYIAQFGGFGAAPGLCNAPGGAAAFGADRVLLADTLNNRIQQFKRITQSEQAKAIVVAGGGPMDGNTLWDATRLCAHYAYHVLLYSGYTKEDIFLISADDSVDLDNDGQTNDVDAPCTLAALEYAIAEWAGSAEQLTVYMVDHGGAAAFRMNASEVLHASQLADWLQQARPSVLGNITVINDSCQSGSFLPAFASAAIEPPVLLLTSAASDQSAYFLGTGTVSFSSLFWTELLNGQDLEQAYRFAAGAVQEIYAMQTAQADGNGDGVANAAEDYAALTDAYLSIHLEDALSRPVIGAVEMPETVSGNAGATIVVQDIQSIEPIAQAWAVVRPPDTGAVAPETPILDMPTLSLEPVSGQTYQGTYAGFNSPGEYHVIVYARDAVGRTSLPVSGTILVDQPLRRRAILVAASQSSSPLWEATRDNVLGAYQALRIQGYSDDDILFFCSETIHSGVDGLPTLSNLQYAVTEWAAANARDAVIYFTGEGATEWLALGENDILFASMLNQWLNTLQSLIVGKPVVVCDFCSAGSFLPALAGPDRIVISGCGENSAPAFQGNGAVSFSRFFWRQVLSGANLRRAFLYARNTLKFTDASHAPLLDDTGDGVYDMARDGRVAATITLGRGVQMAADPPVILQVCPAQVLGENKTDAPTRAEIWANPIVSTVEIASVFAMVIPPDYDPRDCAVGDATTNLLPLALNDGGAYSAIHEGFVERGVYQVSVYARDANGNISAPANTTVEQRLETVTPDAFEPDNTADAASWIGVSGKAQRHNFSAEDDEDWARFYAEEGQLIIVETRYLGPAAATLLQLYLDGDAPELLAEDSYSNPDEENAAYIQWTATSAGFYLVRATNLPQGTYGADAYYDLIVRDATGASIPGAIAVVVRNATTLALMAGVRISLPAFGGLSATTLSNGAALFSALPVNNYTITASLTGYQSASQVVSVGSGDTTSVTFDLQPESVEEGEDPPAPVIVPDLTGLTRAEAEARLLEVGLILGTVAEQYSASVPAGMVISQSPAPDAEVYQGVAVSITLSLGEAPPQQVSVPDLSNKTREEAEAALAAAGLVLGTVSEQYHASIPAGRIISQSPTSGTQVLIGAAISITVSLGPQFIEPIPVPDLSGLTRDEAEAALTSVGLMLGSVAEQYHPTIPAGRVISQSPESLAGVPRNTAVSITLSRGPAPIAPVSVPDLSGMTRNEAESALALSGLVLGNVTEQYHATVPAGQIISQTPTAAASVPSGTAVAITLSLGPDTSAMTREAIAEHLLTNFTAADVNQDGKLDRAEVARLLPGLTDQQFALLDQNGDGVLTQEELEDLVNPPQCGCSGCKETRSLEYKTLLSNWLLLGISLVALRFGLS